MKKSSVLKLIKAMQSELDRSMEFLKSPGHPRPYFISYLARDTVSENVWARYGAVCNDKVDHKRQCFADVRIGNYKYDQITKGGLTDNSEEAESYELIDLPVEDDIDCTRFSLWRLTDARYREAVSNYHGRKSRDVNYLDHNKAFPSFQKVQAEEKIFSLKKYDFQTEKMKKFVKEASKVFKKYDFIKNSYCEYHASITTKVFVSSEGVVRVWQEPLFSLHAYMWAHTKKTNQDVTLAFDTPNFSELPSLSAFKQQMENKISELESLEKADDMTSYAGPVLLAPIAAGLFVHEVLGHRLEGSRLLSDLEGRTFKDKVNKKIMHEHISIYDDPTMKSFNGLSLAGTYPFDDEGMPSKRVTLVEQGVLRGFLTTRSPLKKSGHESNGHARNQGFERPISRMANLIIKSSSSNSWDDLKAQLIEEIKEKKLPFGIILLSVEGGETDTEVYDFQAFKGEITLAVKIFPNGREKFVRGVDFVGTPLSSLMNIKAVGSDLEVDNSYCGAESGSIPVSTVSPAILLSNLELQIKDPAKATQYSLPLPWHDKRFTVKKA